MTRVFSLDLKRIRGERERERESNAVIKDIFNYGNTEMYQFATRCDLSFFLIAVYEVELWQK